MKKSNLLIVSILLAVVLLCVVGWRFSEVLTGEAEGGDRSERAVPVEVAEVEHGPIELRRTFSGTLEALAEFEVAAKVGGRVELLAVNLADEVENGSVVATLDSAEYEQELAQARADLAVATANLKEASSAKELGDRSMQRQTALRERGIASESQFDTASAEQLSAEASVAVAEAQVQRAQSAVETAQIRLGYTQVRATWSEGDATRLVAERMVEAGDTVAANVPLMSIVELDPILAVLHISERDYAQILPGQKVTLRADAYPGREFVGAVVRVSPVFESASRQARVELSVPNPERLLKPGMFVRARAVLKRVEDATLVPELAVVKRDDRPVVFVLNEQAMTAHLTPVELGVADAGMVQVIGEGVSGRVVTLGQQLLDDGSAVVVAEDDPAAAVEQEEDVQ